MRRIDVVTASKVLTRRANVFNPRNCWAVGESIRRHGDVTGPRPISVIVHGGAWSIPDELKGLNVIACKAAAGAAYAVLQDGGGAVDAVEAAVIVLELDESLNAGKGCSLNEHKEPECDALIMDGALRSGAVAGVQVLHPITLARRVMEKTEHILIAGDGAAAFAAQQGLSCDVGEIITSASEAEWQTWREYRSNIKHLFAAGSSSSSMPPGEGRGDTVGCVALDATGMVACGTSTGGVVGKRQGRVGDSPLIGSGGYADVHVGAVSTTGHGEAIARVTLARLALWLLEGSASKEKMSPQAAVETALDVMQRRCGAEGGGTGGLIMVVPSGEVAKSFSTRRMPWASEQGFFGAATSKKLSGIEMEDIEVEK